MTGTLEHGSVYTKNSGNHLLSGYFDSDLGGNVDDRRSTSGMEFMVASTATCQGIWYRNLLSRITNINIGHVVLYIDSHSAIHLARNPVFHGRSKYIDLRFHFVRECVENGEIVIKHIGTEEQRADILTKTLSTAKFKYV